MTCLFSVGPFWFALRPFSIPCYSVARRVSQTGSGFYFYLLVHWLCFIFWYTGFATVLCIGGLVLLLLLLSVTKILRLGFCLSIKVQQINQSLTLSLSLSLSLSVLVVFRFLSFLCSRQVERRFSYVPWRHSTSLPRMALSARVIYMLLQNGIRACIEQRCNRSRLTCWERCNYLGPTFLTLLRPWDKVKVTDYGMNVSQMCPPKSTALTLMLSAPSVKLAECLSTKTAAAT